MIELRHDRLSVRHLVMGGVMALMGMLVMLPAWQDIFLIAYHDEENSHILLVPIIMIYLIAVRRGRFRHCPVNHQALGPVMVAIGWAVSSFGFYRGVQSFWHGGAVLIALGCATSVMGTTVLLRFIPAVAVLAFLVPVPVRIRLQIAIPLQHWTAMVSQRALELCGDLNVEVVGNGLKVNNHPVNIAEACNGVRMVFALLLVSYTFGFGMPLRNSVRGLLLLLSPVAAIFCNVVRVLPTVWMIGYASPAAARFHDYAGWVMLPLAFLILYGIMGVLRWASIPVMRYTLAGQTAA